MCYVFLPNHTSTLWCPLKGTLVSLFDSAGRFPSKEGHPNSVDFLPLSTEIIDPTESFFSYLVFQKAHLHAGIKN